MEVEAEETTRATEFECPSQENNNPEDVKFKEGRKPKPIPLDYMHAEPTLLMKNPNPNYDGYLAPITYQGKRLGSVGWTTNDSEQNEVTAYVYAAASSDNQDGTYVVLQFEESTKYFFARKDRRLRLLKEKYWITKAPNIKTTADPRVFLVKTSMLGGTTDVLLASCVASQQEPGNKSKALVITLFPDPKTPAELMVEGTGNAMEAQLFRVYDYIRSDDGDPGKWKVKTF